MVVAEDVLAAALVAQQRAQGPPAAVVDEGSVGAVAAIPGGIRVVIIPTRGAELHHRGLHRLIGEWGTRDARAVEQNMQRLPAFAGRGSPFGAIRSGDNVNFLRRSRQRERGSVNRAADRIVTRAVLAALLDECPVSSAQTPAAGGRAGKLPCYRPAADLRQLRGYLDTAARRQRRILRSQRLQKAGGHLNDFGRGLRRVGPQLGLNLDLNRVLGQRGGGRVDAVGVNRSLA